MEVFQWVLVTLNPPVHDALQTQAAVQGNVIVFSPEKKKEH